MGGSLLRTGIKAAPGILNGAAAITQAARSRRRQEDLGWGSLLRTGIKAAPGILQGSAAITRAACGREAQQEDLRFRFSGGARIKTPIGSGGIRFGNLEDLQKEFPFLTEEDMQIGAAIAGGLASGAAGAATNWALNRWGPKE